MAVKPREEEIAVLNAAIGNTKKTIASGSGTTTGSFFCIQPLTDCVISELVDGTIEAGTMDGVTLPFPVPYYGNITSLTLTSGTAVLYSFSEIVRV